MGSEKNLKSVLPKVQVETHISGVCPVKLQVSPGGAQDSPTICGIPVESTKFKEDVQGNKLSWCSKHGYVMAIQISEVVI